MTLVHRLLVACVCAALAGCGSSADLKETLGLNRQAPDEFRVLPRPPLSVPPEFNLRPPGQESQYVSGTPAQTRAHEQVLGGDQGGATPMGSAQISRADTAVTPVTASNLPSSSDNQFLSNAGADKVDPRIRQKLLDEHNNGVASSDSRYLFGGKQAQEAQVDPAREADRLKQDKAQNKPVTAGDTPMIAPKDKGILGDIF